MQQKSRYQYSYLLHYYAWVLAFGILILICSGGLVTSKNAGLAVPDWPTTYGYNMFAFPFSRWVGGIFYEHSHRLIASAIGLATFFLAVIVFARDSRRWMCVLAIAAVFAVLIQGLLGGLRVVWLKDYIGIFHAGLAQAYLVLVSLIALFTSRFWLQKTHETHNEHTQHTLKHLLILAFVTTILIYLQLVLGALMRHQHIGLSIPDFPLAYGKVIPSTGPKALDTINNYRQQVLGLPSTTATQIWLQMVHRLNALCIFILTLVGAIYLRRRTKKGTQVSKGMTRLVRFWHIVILVQIVLGIYTIWTNKAADVATAHVAVGAISLVWGAFLIALLYRYRALGSPTETLCHGN